MGLKPFTGICYSDECTAGEHEFIRPRKIRRMTDASVEALVVRLECTMCHKDQDFVMTPANALKAGLKSV